MIHGLIIRSDIVPCLHISPSDLVMFWLRRVPSRQFSENATRAFCHDVDRDRLTNIWLRGGGSELGEFINICNKDDITWPNLTNFSLEASDLDVTDAMAIEFIKRHPSLEYLHIEGSNYLTDGFLDGVTQFLPELIVLSVECNPQLTASGIYRFIKSYENQLEMDVMCEGCEIYPDDANFPEDADYRLAWEDVDAKEVVWFCRIENGSDSEED
jgi:hypothetical protein